MNLIWGSAIILAAGFTDIVSGQQEDPAVTNFREFLRIPTVHPNPLAGYGITLRSHLENTIYRLSIYSHVNI